MLANGIDLDQLCYNVSSRAGRMQTSPRRGKNIEVASRHGSIWTPGKKHTGATVVLTMWVIAADQYGHVPRDGTMRERFHTNLDRLLRIFGSDQVELIDPMPDGSHRRIVGQVLDSIAPEVQAGGTRAQFAVSLICADAFWSDVGDVSASKTGTGVWDVLPFQGATAPMDDLLVRFTAPCTNPRMTNPSGEYLAYNAALSGSQWVELDCGAWTVTGGGGLTGSYSALDHNGNGRWFELLPGDPTPSATFTQTAGATGSVTLTGRRKYLCG